MRNAEQVDKCIDALFTRIQQLEDEVAGLKGVPHRDELRQPAVPAAGQEPSQTRQLPRRPKEPSAASAGNLESAIGTRWIGRIGILAILFGVAFFLKYSFDNKLIGETGRVVLGIVWGVAFIGAGKYFQQKKGWTLYAQALTGGGLAILYLAVYAGFALYHLMPGALATAGLIAVTTTGMTLSARYSAYSLATIALLGGFLTPLMLSTGQNRPLSLFGYILLLDLGALLLLRFRPWRSLALVSLAGTVLMYTLWHAEYFSAGQRWTAFGICTLFFVLYTAAALLMERITRLPAGRFEQSMIFASAGFLTVAVITQQGHACEWTARFLVAGLAAVEALLAWQIQRNSPESRIQSVSCAGASLVLTVVVTCMTVSGHWLAPALAAEAAVFCWMGLTLRMPGLRLTGYAAGVLALITLFDVLPYHHEPFRRFLPVLNSRFCSVALTIAAFYALLWMLATAREQLNHNDRAAQKGAFLASQLLSVLLLSTECLDYFRSTSGDRHLQLTSHRYSLQLTLSILWALYGSIMTGIGIVRRIRAARLFGILMLGLTILKVFLMDLSGLSTVYRIASFIVLGLLLLCVSYFYNRFKTLLFGDEQP